MFYKLVQVTQQGTVTRTVEPYMSGHATHDFLSMPGVNEVQLDDGAMAYQTDTGNFRFEVIA